MFIRVKGEMCSVRTDGLFDELYWDITLNSDIIEAVNAPYIGDKHFTIILKKDNRVFETEDTTCLICKYENREQAMAEYEKIVSTLCEVK